MHPQLHECPVLKVLDGEADARFTKRLICDLLRRNQTL
jgi:hypothetical protein